VCFLKIYLFFFCFLKIYLFFKNLFVFFWVVGLVRV